jgi:uncharacterized protein YndB with AHSA1/START domain
MKNEIDDRVLVLERTFPTTPEKLFDAWTRPEILVRWWGPEGMTIPEHSIDLREGGAWHTTMRNAEGGEVFVSGVYRTIDRPNTLAFTWAWRQTDGSRGEETLVTVTFRAADGGTRLTLDQRSFAEASNRDNHGIGWNSSFDCLEKLF